MQGSKHLNPLHESIEVLSASTAFLYSQVNNRIMTNLRSITSIFRLWGSRKTIISSGSSGTHISRIIIGRREPNTNDGTYESITTEQTSRTTLIWGRCPDSHLPPQGSRVEHPVPRKGNSKRGVKGVRRMTADTGNINCVDTTGGGNQNCVDCVNCRYALLEARASKLLMAMDPDLLFLNREFTDEV